MQAEYDLDPRLKNFPIPRFCTHNVALIVNHLFLFHVFADSTHNSCGQSYLEQL
jgi:hypothetical protein